MIKNTTEKVEDFMESRKATYNVNSKKLNFSDIKAQIFLLVIIINFAFENFSHLDSTKTHLNRGNHFCSFLIEKFSNKGNVRVFFYKLINLIDRVQVPSLITQDWVFVFETFWTWNLFHRSFLCTYFPKSLLARVACCVFSFA